MLGLAAALTVLDPWSKMRSQEADVLGPARYLIATRYVERLSFDEQPCLSRPPKEEDWNGEPRCLMTHHGKTPRKRSKN